MPASEGAGPVLLTIEGGVAELVLNRPDKMNAMNLANARPRRSTSARACVGSAASC